MAETRGTGRTGAELIVDHLIGDGVLYAVGLCGHGVLGLLDALVDRQDEIRTVSVHHEAVAGFVADAYYRVAHRPIATFTSCGPGSANLLVALGSALMDDSALLAITGNVPTSQFNRGPFQETGRHHQADFPSVVRPYVKRSFQATRAEQLPLMLRQAFATMRGGRPGPVNLDVPLDVFVERAPGPETDPALWSAGAHRRTAAAPEDVRAVLELLAEAERPVVVAGSGVESDEATDELMAFVRLAGVPVVTSPLGKSAVPADDPLAMGTTGRNGTYPANKATRNADLVLAFGTRFDDRSTSSWLPGYTYAIPPTRLVHVHVDPGEISRNFPASIGIAAHPREVLRQLAEAWPAHGAASVSHHRLAAWREQVTSWRHEWDEHVAPRRVSDAEPLRPERVLAELRGVLPDDAILLSDVGAHHNWIVQEWPSRLPQTVLQSWGFASMGFGVAGALGARLAAPGRPVVSVAGDGGFLMMPSVVATAVEHDLPVVWLVWDNGGYISIRDQQRAYFGADRELATSFRHEATGRPHRTDVVAMARSMGGDGLRVESPGDLGSAMKAALDAHRPFVLHVLVDDTVAQPAVATWELPPLPVPAPTFGWPD